MVDADDRRRVAILDGDTRHDLVLPLDARLSEALSTLGIRQQVGRDVLMEAGGREISPLQRAEEVPDGTVLAFVDLSQRLSKSSRGRRAARAVPGESVAAWIAVLAVAGLLAVLALAAPSAIPPGARPWLAALSGAGAAATGLVFATRAATGREHSGITAVAVLALAFAAGAVAIPPLPAASLVLAVFTGLLCAAVVAGFVALLTRPPALHSALTTSTTLLLVVAGIWGGALVLSLPAAAPAAVTLGLAPVALRAMLATLVDVPPGFFLDYERYQTTRWSVRQQLPEEVHSIGATDARELVGRSRGRLLAGTLLLCLAAAVCAPFAVVPFDASDPLVLSGRIALAATTVLAFLLGARRFSTPILRWMPRAAAAVVVLAVVLDMIAVLDPALRAGGAIACLALGAAIAFAVVPVGRGARSLVWSRLGDVLEWLAIALSLPAALLAADAVDLLRGMMNA